MACILSSASTWCWNCFYVPENWDSFENMLTLFRLIFFWSTQVVNLRGPVTPEFEESPVSSEEQEAYLNELQANQLSLVRLTYCSVLCFLWLILFAMQAVSQRCWQYLYTCTMSGKFLCRQLAPVKHLLLKLEQKFNGFIYMYDLIRCDMTWVVPFYKYTLSHIQCGIRLRLVEHTVIHWLFFNACLTLFTFN